MGKLDPNLEGPYRITEITHKGSYNLEYMDRKPVKANWNAVYVNRFYF